MPTRSKDKERVIRLYDPVTEFKEACHEIDEFIRLNPIMPYDDCIKFIEAQKEAPFSQKRYCDKEAA